MSEANLSTGNYCVPHKGNRELSVRDGMHTGRRHIAVVRMLLLERSRHVCCGPDGDIDLTDHQPLYILSSSEEE